MEELDADTVEAFNAMVEKQKKEPPTRLLFHLFRLILFL